ncbi:putative HVA22-like protein g [Amaranthus tricolor]|uniref:putative HVA22-like protein g n=1 Tax=Amaranthus tricolor TaxID=29722 RepID=UPI002590E554|nr:putative HVA22-like protein g [Amaranthus tricolor]XP_057536165.1 putative HVA22-like protein g [Amaranthus tricolor]
MIGEFISRGLFMILGFAYPAFECFKTVERNRVSIEELRFWCQYWIIVAVLSVGERFGDVFISWVPLYEELKLGFIIYLWYPQTKGTSYVYESMLKPFVSKHETDIEKNLKELRLRIWDLAIYYYQNCTELGSSAFFNVIQYVANQSSKLKGGSTTEGNDWNQKPKDNQPPSSSGSGFSWSLRQRRPKEKSPTSSPRHDNQKWPQPPAEEQPAPAPPPATFPTLFKAEAHNKKSKLVQMKVDKAQTEYVNFEQDEAHLRSPIRQKSKMKSTRLKFRRSKSIQ